MSLLALESVKKSYKLGRTVVSALQGVDMLADRGQFVTVKGPSGSGKTTLLNIIGLIDSPSSGSVSLLGNDLTAAGERILTRWRSDHIGYIFQSFNLIPTLTAGENVMYPLNRWPLTHRERRSRAMQILAAVGLGGCYRRFPRELSGGEQQRVAVARALVKNPAIVLADEPTANLDSDSGRMIVDLLHDLKKRSGSLVILGTHDPEIIQRSDILYLLRDGQLIEDGTVR